MARPLSTRGAKSRANLKRGGRDGKRAPSKRSIDESRRLSRRLLADPTYRKTLMKRLRTGTIQPGVEALLWYYAHGKPKETVESVQETQVKIVHQYADDDPKPAKPAK